ncbi:methyltransferase domain-containing protein [Clostridium sp. YIM B02515]|uniref:Methyltransferase domain-containing protein n=1 Tax=Clostridium rhizosphaerae TaxID=2803861 RepID=A0ABS1T6Q1_9CLOT|nr:class I SAM-dependent methyltransferase [Clostridium rhizosphaerae]MBL4935024.1 methyltransferase domain-containing protein [Clostridium rhizosphaerae]
MVSKIEPYKGIAATYDEIRPSYPEKLIEDIITKTGISLGDRLLEIGPGTGKATIQFADKGFSVHGIELGEDMAAILRNKCKQYEKVTVDVVPFEQWTGVDNEEYDMIYCAQAFHWLDPKIKYEKCHKLLKDGGYLVLFWYNPCDDDSLKAKERQNKINTIVKKYVSISFVKNENSRRREHDGVYKEDERLKEIENSSLFTLVEKIEYLLETRNNSDEYLKVMKTVPAFASILDGLDDMCISNMNNEIKEVINEYGGYVSSFLNFSLYITKKVS